ncbi:PHD and RING finger domain-containing protein c [Histoplasma capsulatum G186AR]|uniref:PHD and RING finger domain-containing protein c n=2 Tax=Ajellomyces capsulatus TaxID=5037 RepID=C0NWA7_AJECG|nr:PHD and RING finger domain-containing protein c [Histoplasma capsulatum G186AR]EEH04212.1 PHD and RING finger domain-containing protein c [Histoplasma capsulatum G186AR]KAG5291163.1 PHD and RING finger domain-containing protein c [Histoplasma capsulatum]QSS68466.1 PHD and RING finger domain-containing protein c [Histoplasma capsulatum G186AR]
MPDTCIVCLGDLGDGASEPPSLRSVVDALPPRPVNTDEAPVLEVVVKSPQIDLDPDSGKIAHLLPCGHNLHDDCLKPWVERANSCPICRQNFNMVELTHTVGGPVVSTYCVQDRVQVAEIDPSMVMDDLGDESDSQPCPICGYSDNEDVLLLCDGCDVAIHTYCVGLDSVPSGPWHCSQCETQRPISAVGQRLPNRSGRRTRSDQRRTRSRNQMHAFHWARVWQTVWDHLNLDLDFPFDDEQANSRSAEQQRREANNRREFRAWERRFQIAERQGAANRFRDTASALLEIGRGWPSRPRQRIETPEPESLDEVRAWNAFERAREIQDDPCSNRRKRKSPTASPVEPQPPQPERKLKRPRTRRPEALAADFLDHGGESSRSGRSANGSASSGRVPADSNASTGPSFLQSLLKEVEDSSAPGLTNGSLRSAAFSSTRGDSNSPRPSSPTQSSLSSNRSSPRPSFSTPPPYNNSNRPATPTAISDPSYSSPEFSPSCSPNQEEPGTAEQPRLPRQMDRTRRAGYSSSTSPSRSLSDESSPTRSSLSLSVKSDLQKMVSAALKPHYRSRGVSKDEYTDINRRISRFLYDKVGTTVALDVESKTKWQAVAKEEVNRAIARLKESRDLNKACETSDINQVFS